MTSTLHLTKIQNWIGNKTIFETIVDRNRIDTVVRELESEKGYVNAEILQFVSPFPLYKKLEQKRRSIVEEISATDDYVERLKISEKLNAIQQEEKEFIKNVLYAGNMFTGLEMKDSMEDVAESFFSGDIEKANELLNPDSIQNKQCDLLVYLKERKKLENTYDKLEDNANEFKVKAQLTMLNLEITNPEDRFQKSISFFEFGQLSANATKRRPFIAHYLLEHSNFLINHNQFQKAEPLGENALEIYRTLSQKNEMEYLPYLSTALNDLAVLQKNINEYELSFQKYEESIRIRRLMAERNPFYLQLLAETLNNLAVLEIEKEEFEKAAVNLEEAISIYRNLVEEDSATYLPGLAMALGNFGILFYSKKEFEAAKEKLNESLDIYQSLSNKNLKLYLHKVAGLLNNLGLLNQAKGEIVKSREYLEKALQIYKELSTDNPSVNLPFEATTLTNLASLHSFEDNFTEACKKYEEALYVYKRLSDENPSTYLIFLADASFNLGVVLQMENKFMNALEKYEESAKIYRLYVEKDLYKFSPNLTEALTKIAFLRNKNNEFEQSMMNYKEASIYYRLLAEKNLNEYLPELAETLYSLAFIQKDNNEISQAEENFQDALKIYRALYDKNPERYLRKFIATQVNLSIFYSEYIGDNDMTNVLSMEVVQVLFPLRNEMPDLMNYLSTSLKLLQKNGIDVEEIINDLI